MTAYYNEIDPYAAQWLRNLIAAGHIAPGVVDERSIEDVIPDELREFTQCHFFAGIGVWSLALRNAGWPDDRPVWTGSCPCQPFSAAGQGGGFDDERHLWPAFFHLIEQRRPATIFGEQVASRDANPWIDLVQTDLEALGYGVGAVAFPSASVGAPHTRDRLYWVADAECIKREERLSGLGEGDCTQGSGQAVKPSGFCMSGGLANTSSRRVRAQGLGATGATPQGVCREDGQWERLWTDFGASSTAGTERLADPDGEQRSSRKPGICNEHEAAGRQQGAAEASGLCIDSGRPGPTNGLWSAADWLLCRDGKWRPVESGTFPLAHGATSRVGRLRAYGNAINAQAAQVIIESYLQCTQP